MKLSTPSRGALRDAPHVGLLTPLPGVTVRQHPERSQVQRFLQELQLPLAASGTMLDLLDGAGLPESVAMAVAALRNHNDYLQRHVADYLSYGKLEQDQVASVPETCDTFAWLDAIFASQRKLAEQIDVDLNVTYRGFLPDCVVLDAALVEQALSSVLHVAMQRSLPTQLHVAVHYVEGRNRGESSQLVFELQTRGGGFAEIELGYVFAPFQVRDAAARPLLGLSLCQRRAELAGGQLRVESAGRSSCSYRMSVSAEPAEHAVWLDPVSRGGDYGSVRPGCVLFVGRCERTVQRCRPALESAGYSVERAEPAELVLARLEEQPKQWSVVVVDATCARERRRDFVAKARRLGYDAPLLTLVEDAGDAGKSEPDMDAQMYAPSGQAVLHAIRMARAERCSRSYKDRKNAANAD